MTSLLGFDRLPEPTDVGMVERLQESLVGIRCQW
jgi:hypothetical protein